MNELKVVNKKLSLTEFVNAISDVVNIVFVNGEYYSYMKQPAIKYIFAKYYIGMDLKGLTFENVYDIMSNINIVDFATDNDINMIQLYDLLNAIDDETKYLTELSLNNNSSISKLLNSVTSLANIMEEKFSDTEFDNTLVGLSKLGNKVKDIGEKKLANSMAKQFVKARSEYSEKYKDDNKEE